MTERDRLLAAIRPALAAAPEGEIGVAVSGGGDSVALLLLMQAWAAEAGRRVAAVTVDHGLRPESADEAAAVAALCRARGIPHEVRRWAEPAGRGNLQDRARRARRRLIADWARGRGIGAVALGHTLDDQAETLLMRLARGSGVDGLAAMPRAAAAGGMVWLRPMLGLRRAALRDWLRDEGVGWAEDASNADPRFDRVRARAAMAALEPLGLGAERLAATAARMGRARMALEGLASDCARACLRKGEAGDVDLDPAVLAAAPEEVRLRVLAGALAWVAGAEYRPRLLRLEALMAAIAAGRLGHGMTLHGCVLRPRRGLVSIRREPARVAPPVPAAERVWDGRWALDGATEAGLTIGALGAEGLAACPNWRATGTPREVLLTTPALRRGDGLVAAPFARPGDGAVFRRIPGALDPWAPAFAL